MAVRVGSYVPFNARATHELLRGAEFEGIALTARLDDDKGEYPAGRFRPTV